MSASVQVGALSIGPCKLHSVRIDFQPLTSTFLGSIREHCKACSTRGGSAFAPIDAHLLPVHVVDTCIYAGAFMGSDSSVFMLQLKAPICELGSLAAMRS